MPATSVMPQRGHVPGWSDRMSGSIGQTYARSRDGSGPAALRAGDDVFDVEAGAGDACWHPASSKAASATLGRAVRRIAAYCTALAALGLAVADLSAHDPSSVPITWNREISRVVFDRCATCHRQGGTAFSLMTYKDAQPRADAIKASVISRRMPPWGAVKGFGNFRNDTGLTQEQVALFAEWVEGGAPRGNNPNALPQAPTFAAASEFHTPADAMTITGDVTLDRAMSLDGMLPVHVADGTEMRIVAARPDGAVEPLLWLYEYKDAYRHPFLFRKPVELPAGTTIRGVRAGATIQLLPASTSWFWSLPLLRTIFSAR
jgi:mono/diheme cytochrome c family protein